MARFLCMVVVAPLHALCDLGRWRRLDDDFLRRVVAADVARSDAATAVKLHPPSARSPIACADLASATLRKLPLESCLNEGLKFAGAQVTGQRAWAHHTAPSHFSTPQPSAFAAAMSLVRFIPATPAHSCPERANNSIAECSPRRVSTPP